MPKIVLEYSSGLFNNKPATIEDNGNYIGQIQPGSIKDFLVFRGSHTLVVKIGNTRSKPLQLTIDERDRVSLKCWSTGFIKPNILLEKVYKQELKDRFSTVGSKYYEQQRSINGEDGFNLSWPSILGVSENSSLAEIRSAYISLMKENHPDKMLGQHPQLQNEAIEKSISYSIAYRHAKQMKKR